MPECYIGRGRLYARKLSEPNSGFIQVTGESEVTVTLSEERGTVVDRRYGRQEQVDSFAKSTQAKLEAEVFDWKEVNLALLLKGTKATVASGVGRAYSFPDPIVLQSVYPLPHSKILPGATLEDDDATPLVQGTHYLLDETLGLVEFINLTGLNQPISIEYDNATYDELGINTQASIALELMFRGFNRVTSGAVMATFYHAELNIGETMKLISKEFSGIPFKCDLIADFSKHVNATLSHYGKVLKL